MTRSRISALVVGVSLTLASSVGSAQTTFDFANLIYNGGNSWTAGSFKPTNGTECTGGDICSTVGGPLTFTKNGITVNAFGFYNSIGAPTSSNPGVAAMVVQDHENGYNQALRIGAGLGVYHEISNGTPTNSSDDNITAGEMLKLSFANVIALGTIQLRSDGHDVNWVQNSRFEYSTNGTAWTSASFPSDGTFNVNTNTKDFYLRYDSRSGDQFYLAGATVSTVPEPSTWALMGAGLVGLGIVARRRRRQHTA